MTEIMTRDVALNKISSDIRELEGILESVVANDTGILDALSQMLSAMHQMQRKNEQLQKRLTDELSALTEAVQQLDLRARSLQKAIVVDGDPDADQNPEDGLLEFLFAFLPNTTAIDIGANVGRVSDRLLATGYTVYAFEPYAPSFQKLTQRLSGQKNFHAFEYAIGSDDSTMNLNVAADTSGENKWDPTLFNSLTDHAMLEDCKFTSTLPVKVRSLESLQKAGEIPESAGLLKIDTEGFDLNVIRGMGNGKFSVVMTRILGSSPSVWCLGSRTARGSCHGNEGAWFRLVHRDLSRGRNVHDLLLLEPAADCSQVVGKCFVLFRSCDLYPCDPLVWRGSSADALSLILFLMIHLVHTLGGSVEPDQAVVSRDAGRCGAQRGESCRG